MELTNLSSLERLKYYREHGFTADALSDLDTRIRIPAYYELGYTRDALTDESPLIRWYASVFFDEFNLEDTSLYYLQQYYRYKGYTIEQLNSSIDWVRHDACMIFGFPESGRADPYLAIRVESFRIWGYTPAALLDVDSGIRHEAYEYLGYTSIALIDTAPSIVEAATRFFNNQPT